MKSEYFRVAINGDPERVIKWRKNDTRLLKRLDSFFEYANAIPARVNEISVEGDPLEDVRIAAIGREVENEFDRVFGAGTSAIAFQGVNPLGVSEKTRQCLFVDLLQMLAPYIIKTLGGE